MVVARRRVIPIAAAFGLALLAPSPATAGCVSACRDDYDSEVDSCRSDHDDPDEADDLRMCIDNAKDTYDECIHECRS